MTTPDSSSDLCTKCGICCSGILFDTVPVAPDEAERLSALGLVLDEAEGEMSFKLGCPMLCERRCTVYEQRPARCQKYRCALLEKYQAGEIAYEPASALVDQALALIESVRPYAERLGVRRAAGPLWSRCFAEWHSLDAEERVAPENARHMLDLTRLNMLLDRHFRRGKQRRLLKDE